MHLAIITPFPPAITGIGQYGYHMSRALAASGAFARVTVLAGSHTHDASPHSPELDIEYCWTPDRPGARTAILARIRELRPDLAWFNMGVSVFGKSPWANVSGLSTPGAVRGMGYPTVVTLHELIELADLQQLQAPGGPFALWGARFLTDIATRSDITCLTMRHYANWLSNRRPGSRYIHIPIGAYHPPEILPAPETPELLFFGTLAPYKGLEFLLEAFALLKTETPDLALTIAGVGHARFPRYLDELKNSFGRLDGINWLGAVQEEDLRSLFGRAQLVILPSQASTGSSSVLIQAATWGRPVVISDLEENQRFVREMGLDVSFFEQGSTASLVEVLRGQLASPALRTAQARQNNAAIWRVRMEVVCHAYLNAFNLALEARQSAKRIPVPVPPQLELA